MLKSMGNYSPNHVADIFISIMNNAPEGYGIVGFRPIQKGDLYIGVDHKGKPFLAGPVKFDDQDCYRPIVKSLFPDSRERKDPQDWMKHDASVINIWPWSQGCNGCKYATLMLDCEEFGSSAYSCELSIERNRGAAECPAFAEKEE